jgi:hypothetical protein
VDHFKSVTMIVDDYVHTMEEKVARNEALEKEKKMKRMEVELTKDRQA